MERRGSKFLSPIIGLPMELIWPQSGFRVPLLVSLNGCGKAMLTLQYLLSQAGDGHWQDAMLSAGNIFFCFTLIPMLRQPERPPLLTCIPTGLALLAGGFVFATLHLWLTALTQMITGLQWLALVFKRPPQPASSFANSSETIATTDQDIGRVIGEAGFTLASDSGASPTS